MLAVEDPGGPRHHPDPVVVEVGDEHAAAWPGGHPLHPAQFGAARVMPVAGEAGDATPAVTAS